MLGYVFLSCLWMSRTIQDCTCFSCNHPCYQQQAKVDLNLWRQRSFTRILSGSISLSAHTANYFSHNRMGWWETEWTRSALGNSPVLKSLSFQHFSFLICLKLFQEKYLGYIIKSQCKPGLEKWWLSNSECALPFSPYGRRSRGL